MDGSLINRDGIARALAELGLKRDDIVIVHSSLSSIGRVDGGADAVVDAFLEVIGPGGTLLVPAFGALGIITEVVRNRPGAVQSCHPKASVAGIGRDAEAICKDHWKESTAHGEGTPYLRIAEMGGYVCLLGVDQDRNTTLHSPESLLCLPYLNPTKEITFATDEGEVTKSWDYFPGPHRDFIGIDKVLRESGKMQAGLVGRAVARLIKSRDLIDICVEAGRADPAVVLCDNPNCADCVKQRAALSRNRFEQEAFTMVTSAALAGRYVPEMIENMQQAGIVHVELDYLQGKPMQVTSSGKLAAAVSELQENDCVVVSLRLSAVPESLDAALGIAAEADIKRIVLPISMAAAEHIRTATAKGVYVSFCNVSMSSAKASAILLALKTEGLNPRFTFNAANFAAAGEKPFLSSYKQKVRRFIDQLDVEDATFAGLPTRLAGGNAEIKEMMSILRCGSFDGYFVLGAGNRAIGSLPEVATRALALLENM